jgi:hypothetical protein
MLNSLSISFFFCAYGFARSPSRTRERRTRHTTFPRSLAALATLALAPLVASAASLDDDLFIVEYSKALTPQQFDAAYRSAHDEFFDVSHAP